jgi:glycosyltransferase involved in cell wall biosynthesis
LIVTPARLSPEKGIAVLLAAVRRVLPRYPSARFIVFGDGPEHDSLARRIASDDLGHAVALAGFQTDLDRLLPNADLLVLPSFTEGLPNVVLEAAAAGVPVVATAVGGTPEAVRAGQTGLLVPPGDSEAMACSIGDLLAEPALRRAMGDAAKNLVRTKFSFAAQADEYVQLFAKLGVTPAVTRESVAA